MLQTFLPRALAFTVAAGAALSTTHVIDTPPRPQSLLLRPEVVSRPIGEGRVQELVLPPGRIAHRCHPEGRRGLVLHGRRDRRRPRVREHARSRCARPSDRAGARRSEPAVLQRSVEPLRRATRLSSGPPWTPATRRCSPRRRCGMRRLRSEPSSPTCQGRSEPTVGSRWSSHSGLRSPSQRCGDQTMPWRSTSLWVTTSLRVPTRWCNARRRTGRHRPVLRWRGRSGRGRVLSLTLI